MIKRSLSIVCVLGIALLIGMVTSGCGGRKVVAEKPGKKIEASAEDEAKRKAEEAAKRKAEEERLAAEAAKRKAEEKRLVEEAAKRKAEEEAHRKAELTFEGIRFDFDRYTLHPDAQKILGQHAKVLDKYADVNVTIEGHCDERGTTEYNLALGERRAKSARDYLVRYGIGIKRLKTVSFGEERPVDPHHNEAAWTKNRRAEFVIEE